ncbi:hypothetical protein C8J57DRAFT_1633765 [Mycena rebaudengoi]|nr:hypothetical protein C8J57DRAFT_1633765 [Mycena rebaudengoi]
MPRGPPRQRNLPPIAPHVYSEIAQHINDSRTLAALNSTSSGIYMATRFYLYRSIHVVNTGHLLVRTLAENPALPLMVRSLQFTGVARAFVKIVGADWIKVLVAMENLKHLRVQQHVHFDERIIPIIRFRLNSFVAGTSISTGWDALIRAQVHIQSITAYGFSTFLAGTPPPNWVNLEHVTAFASHLASFLEVYPLTSVRFCTYRVHGTIGLPLHTLERFARLPATVVKMQAMCTQFSLLEAAGPWLLLLQELVVDEGDGDWNKHLARIKSIASQLKAERLPVLSSLTFATSWNGSYFQVRGLKGFGVRLQLGHPTPECCPNPVPDNTFRIIDYHYRHHVALDYCGCCSHSQYDQLINARLLPSLTRTSRATVFDLGFPDFIMPHGGATGNLLVHDASKISSAHEKRNRRRASLAERTATRATNQSAVDESLGWDHICDALMEADTAAPRATLEQPPSGFVYVTDDDGSVYRICTYGIDECRVYMGPESRVQIPDDPEEEEFVEGQRMEDIWTAVLERQTAAGEVLREHAGDPTLVRHFLAIPVQDIMPALQGCPLDHDAGQEMSSGQAWCCKQMVKYDRDAALPFE